MDEANKINRALITNVNKPRVKRLMGKVRTINIGFKVTFTKPKNKANHRAAQIPLIATPGTIKATNKMDMAIVAHFKIKFIYFYVI